MVNDNRIDEGQDPDLSLNEARLAALLELTQMAKRSNERQIVQKALAYAVGLTNSAFGSFHLVHQDQKTLKLITWLEGETERPKAEFDKHYLLDQNGVWVECIRVGKPVVQNDSQNILEKNIYPENNIPVFRQVRLPFFDKDRVRILLSVVNKTTDYHSTDVLFLSLIGDQLIKIIQHQQIENALVTAKHQYELFAKHIPIGIYRARTKAQGPLVFEHVNQRFCEMLNLSSEDVYQDSDKAFSIIHQNDLEAFVDLNRELLRAPQPFSWEGRAVVNGKIKWLRVESRPELLDNGDVIWYGVQTDITERKQAEKAFRDANTLLENRLAEIEQLQGQLREQAIRDYLTRLFNRRYLDETIEREISRAQREARKLSVVMMDIDHFKSINDTYGHQAGDMVLIDLGVLLTKNSRASDIACRHGGDEFVVVMPNASPDDAFKRAEEWRRAFEQKRFAFGERRFATTLSMGIASYPLHASSPKGVFQAADQALYQSKLHNNTVTISRRIATNTLKSLGNSKSS